MYVWEKMTGVAYQRDWIAAMYNRWPVRSLIHVRRSRLRMATHCEGMTSKFVWNCKTICQLESAVRTEKVYALL